MRPSVYILDDDIVFAKLMKANLGRVGEFKIEIFNEASECLAAISETPPRLLVTDLYMDDVDGIEVSRRVRAQHPHLPVFVVTAQGEIETAVQAMKAGATEYVVKPVNVDRFATLIRRALDEAPLLAEAQEIRSARKSTYALDKLIGEHPLMGRTREFVRGIAKVRQVSVLLLGESGVGKNLVAQTIHYSGDEPHGRFVELNCAALPDTLLEAELFGYMKGAFTDARENKQGLAEVADGGTLFLDEIAEMSLPLQAKLLGFVESRRFRRLGATREREVDVRLVTATNRPLEESVAAGEFRQDLFYRISTATHTLPALREMKEDIPLLADHFSRQLGREFGKGIEGVSDAAKARLEEWPWYGNVRELRNTLERALIFAEGHVIGVDDLPRDPVSSTAPVGGQGGGSGLPTGLTLKELERAYLEQTLDRIDGIGDAADELGISRKSLWEKRKRYGLMD